MMVFVSTAESDRMTNKDKLLSAALRCFERAGLKRTGAEDVAQEAGLSRSAFYRCFRSIDDMIIQLVVARVKRGLTAAIESAATEPVTRRRWALFVLNFIREMRSDDEAALLNTTDMSFRSQALIYIENPAVFDEVVNIIRPHLERDQRLGSLRFDLDPHEMAEWLLRQSWTFLVAPRPEGLDMEAHVATFVIAGLLPATAPVDADGLAPQMAAIVQGFGALDEGLKRIEQRLGQIFPHPKT